MKKFLFIIVVFLMAACSQDDDSNFSPAVYRYGNTTFQIVDAYDTTVEIKSSNVSFSAYVLKFNMDGSVHSYVFTKDVTESIDVRYPFNYIKIEAVEPLLP